MSDGDLSATVYGGTSRLMSLVHGEAALSSIKISQTYFGIGNFVGDELKVDCNKASLQYHGSLKLHRPGYELPLGKVMLGMTHKKSVTINPYQQ